MSNSYPMAIPEGPCPHSLLSPISKPPSPSCETGWPPSSPSPVPPSPQVRDQLGATFKELRGVSVDNLMYIKEDIILPQHYTFYELIKTKARGKSGPLFEFGVHEDIRMVRRGGGSEARQG